MYETDAIRDYYDARVAEEWRRLDESWLEFSVTRHFIGQYLRPNATVLDIGGGPGRYALDLAAAGHTVDLADLSQANIAFAQEQVQQMGVELRQALVMDARDLSMFADASYDLVLNLGPLYHLTEKEDRIQTVRESLRVLKPGGHAFFAFISRYAPAYHHLKTLTEGARFDFDLFNHILKSGTHTPSGDRSFFTDSFFIDPSEIRAFMRACGAVERLLFGAESMMAQSENRLAGLSEVERQAWLNLAIELAPSPAALYGSEHIVFVGRNDRQSQ